MWTSRKYRSGCQTAASLGLGLLLHAFKLRLILHTFNRREWRAVWGTKWEQLTGNRSSDSESAAGEAWPWEQRPGRARPSSRPVAGAAAATRRRAVAPRQA